jgi:[acyl-carrier-protein] S-malonyltransferase
MAPAQVRLDAALAGAAFHETSVVVVANVDALPHEDPGGWAERLSSQLCQRVRWRESLLRLSALGADHFLELGPGTELSGMVKRTVTEAGRSNIATPDDLASLGDLGALGDPAGGSAG